MKQNNYIAVDGTEQGIDFDAHYKVTRWPAVAFRLLGWQAAFEPVNCYVLDDDGNEIEMESGEFDEVPDFDYVVGVMVGDDRRHVIEVCDLELIPEDGFCRECGQIGCGCNVYA